LPEITDVQLLTEPARKNTAPCIAYAAFKINKINEHANIIVAPSDHIILKEDEFVRIADLLRLILFQKMMHWYIRHSTYSA
jgi:mannose-1-phosphate guanylyltransferase